MPFEQSVSALVELGINQALHTSVNGWDLIEPLIGKRCVVHLQEPKLTFAFHFAANTVDVTFVSELEGDEQEVYFNTIPDNECYVSVSVFAINELKQTSQLTKLIKQGKLDFYGDLGVVQKFSKVFAEIEFDIEETLSKYFGDAQAYTVVNQSQKLREHFQSQSELLKSVLSDAALEEKPIAVRPIMVANYVDEVRQLKMDAERLEARIERFANIHKVSARGGK